MDRKKKYFVVKFFKCGYCGKVSYQLLVESRWLFWVKNILICKNCGFRNVIKNNPMLNLILKTKQEILFGKAVEIINKSGELYKRPDFKRWNQINQNKPTDDSWGFAIKYLLGFFILTFLLKISNSLCNMPGGECIGQPMNWENALEIAAFIYLVISVIYIEDLKREIKKYKENSSIENL